MRYDLSMPSYAKRALPASRWIEHGAENGRRNQAHPVAKTKHGPSLREIPNLNLWLPKIQFEIDLTASASQNKRLSFCLIRIPTSVVCRPTEVCRKGYLLVLEVKC